MRQTSAESAVTCEIGVFQAAVADAAELLVSGAACGSRRFVASSACARAGSAQPASTMSANASMKGMRKSVLRAALGVGQRAVPPPTLLEPHPWPQYSRCTQPHAFGAIIPECHR